MNTLMYEHPLTAEHIRIVQDVVKYQVVGPIGKGLACGDVGKFLIIDCEEVADGGLRNRTRSDDRMARYCQDRS